MVENIISWQRLETETEGTFIGVPGFRFVLDLPANMNDHFKKPFRTEYFYILLVTQGNISISMNLEEYNVKKNNIFLCPPNSLRQLYGVDKDTIISSIGFTADFISHFGIENEDSFIAYFSSRLSPIWEVSEKNLIRIKRSFEIIDECLKEHANYPYKKELVLHNFIILLYEISGSAILSRRYIKKNFSRKEELVSEFIKKVKENYRFLRLVKSYASQLNITPKYLTETTKEITGRNASKIIDDYVLLEIKHQLNDPRITISEIANVLNFSDVSSLSSFFKRKTSISLRQYRKNIL